MGNPEFFSGERLSVFLQYSCDSIVLWSEVLGSKNQLQHLLWYDLEQVMQLLQKLHL